MAVSSSSSPVRASSRTESVRYEIRGELARRAAELEAQGRVIAKLNIGNPGLFGFTVSDHVRSAIEQNLGRSEAYCHQKGLESARAVIVQQMQAAQKDSKGNLRVDVTAQVATQELIQIQQETSRLR